LELEKHYVEVSLDSCRKDLGLLDSSVVGSAFFFAIIGVFGIWLAIAGMILAIAFAVTTVSFVSAEGGAR
jgi:uncharacterized membrane protein YccF (DUF307 family)